MQQLRLIARLFSFALVLLGYFFASLVILFLNGMNLQRARGALTGLIARTCRLGLWIFNIKVNADGPMPNDQEGRLIVANHLSYVDVFAISSLFPTSFVTSHEMRETPFLGHLCQLGGCLFVERRTRRQLAAEVDELTKALKDNITVTIFPESTSTNGEKVHPFRKPLFQAALNSGKKIHPLCLNYESIDGEAISLKNRDVVFWYGDFPFFRHALRLLKHKELVVHVTLLPLMDPKRSDKYALSHEAHQEISGHYKNIV